MIRARSGGSLRWAARPTPGAWLWLVGIIAAFSIQAWGWSFLCDDAYIAFRYAHNWARSGAPSFNPGIDPPVEGYTSFSWVALLATMDRVGISPIRAAPVLTVLATVAAMLAMVALGRALRWHWGRAPETRLTPDDLIPAALAVVLPEFMVWSGSGLETNLAVALVLGALWAGTTARWRGAGILGSLAILTRPDTALPMAVYLLILIGERWVRPRGSRSPIDRRSVLVGMALFIVPIVIHLSWRRAYYGEWLPNTWAIKAHGRLLRETWGQNYVLTWAQSVGLVAFVPLVPLIRRGHVAPMLAAAAVVAWAWWIGGDFMAYGRFLVIATALLCVVMGWLLVEAGGILGRRWPWARSSSAVVGLAFTFVLGLRAHDRWQKDRNTAMGWIDGRWEGVTAMDHFARVRRIAGAWMADHLPPQTRIIVGAAGAVPYASGLPAYDAFGLVTPSLVRGIQPRSGKGARPGHQLHAPMARVRALDPDLWCHVGYHGKSPPERRHIPASLRSSHVWACANPGPVFDDVSGMTLDIGFYCCLRPKDRVVGPFGADSSGEAGS